MTNMIGICGDNCLSCPRYVATKTGSPEELTEVKKLWVTLGLRDPAFPLQEMACYGCKPENKCAYPELRECANQRAIENCGSCQQYPCGLINAVFQKSEALFSHAVQVCTPNELAMLKKAFFSKKQNLDRIHHEIKEGLHGKRQKVKGWVYLWQFLCGK
jgi:hypothetical protein